MRVNPHIGPSPDGSRTVGMFMVCDECRRLWRELGDSTAIAIRLDNKLKLLALQHNYEKVKILTPETEAAFAVRDRARELIRLHEATEHGKQRCFTGGEPRTE